MRLHHVQVACPPGGEDVARRFWAEGLGLTEVAKPADLAGRGGAWFRSYADSGEVAAEVHVGVEDPFAPARKAHPRCCSTASRSWRPPRPGSRGSASRSTGPSGTPSPATSAATPATATATGSSSSPDLGRLAGGGTVTDTFSDHGQGDDTCISVEVIVDGTCEHV